MKALEGRVGVVTGASSGIGFATALALGRSGMNLVMASQNADRLHAAVEQVRDTGAQVIGVPTDVGDEEAVQSLSLATVKRFGGVHLLMNNAGVFVPGFLWEISQRDWDWVIDVNLRAAIFALRAFMPIMLQQDEGHVINVASSGGLMTAPAHAPYCATKHALVGLSKALRTDIEIKGAPIGVTVVCPGAVATPITSQAERTGPGGVARGDFDLPPGAAEAWAVIRDFADAGVDAAQAADQIVNAIQANQFWCLPNAQVFHEIFDQELADIKAQR